MNAPDTLVAAVLLFLIVLFASHALTESSSSYVHLTTESDRMSRIILVSQSFIASNRTFPNLIVDDLPRTVHVGAHTLIIDESPHEGTCIVRFGFRRATATLVKVYVCEVS